MRYGSGKFDMAKTLPPHFGLDDFDATFFTDDTAMLHALVLAAIAFEIFHRAEDFGAKQTIALRLEGSVVDGFGLFHLAMRPIHDLFRRSQRDLDALEFDWSFRFLKKIEQFFHEITSPLCKGLPRRPFA
jgi:hypothetical protein